MWTGATFAPGRTIGFAMPSMTIRSSPLSPLSTTRRPSDIVPSTGVATAVFSSVDSQHDLVGLIGEDRGVGHEERCRFPAKQDEAAEHAGCRQLVLLSKTARRDRCGNVR